MNTLADRQHRSNTRMTAERPPAKLGNPWAASDCLQGLPDPSNGSMPAGSYASCWLSLTVRLTKTQPEQTGEAAGESLCLVDGKWKAYSGESSLE